METMTIKVEAAALKAVSLAMTDRLPRDCVNGVFVEVKENAAWLVATDSHRMHVLRVDVTSAQPWSVVVPHDIVESALREFRPTRTRGLMITITYDGVAVTLSARGRSIKAIPPQGEYLNWRHAVPRQVSGEAAQYDLKFLADADEAIRLLGGLGTQVMHYNGPRPGVKVFGGFMAVIMPLHIRDAGKINECISDIID